MEYDTEIKGLQVYEAVPPSVVQSWCAHFAEVIIKAHHVEILEKTLRPSDAFVLSSELLSCRSSFIERHGASSPHIQWENINDKEGPSEKLIPGPSVTDNFLRHIESKDVLAVHDLIVNLNAKWPQPHTENLGLDRSDPSAYVSSGTAWEIIMRADQCMRHIYVNCRGGVNTLFSLLVDEIVATAVSTIPQVGAPSWGLDISSQAINRFWWEIFPAACDKALNPHSFQIESLRDLRYDRWAPIYARLSILRAAYYTILMRAAQEIGPGLTVESRIDTALAYMA